MARKKKNRAAQALSTDTQFQAAEVAAAKLPEGRAAQILKQEKGSNKLDGLQRRFDTQNKRGHIRTHLKQAVREAGGTISGNRENRSLDLPGNKRPSYGPTGYGKPQPAKPSFGADGYGRPGFGGRTSTKPLTPPRDPNALKPIDQGTNSTGAFSPNAWATKPPEQRTDPLPSRPKKRRKSKSGFLGRY